MWLYQKSECNLWTVGFYEPDGEWTAVTDHPFEDEAAERVHYLNGGQKEIHCSCEE